jgi:hypothetical protein
MNLVHRLNLQNHNLKTCKLVQQLSNPLQCLVGNILMYGISCMRVVMPTFSLPLPVKECISKFIRIIVCPDLFSVKTKFTIHLCQVFFCTHDEVLSQSDKICPSNWTRENIPGRLSMHPWTPLNFHFSSHKVQWTRDQGVQPVRQKLLHVSTHGERLGLGDDLANASRAPLFAALLRRRTIDDAAVTANRSQLVDSALPYMASGMSMVR